MSKEMFTIFPEVQYFQSSIETLPYSYYSLKPRGKDKYQLVNLKVFILDFDELIEIF